MRDTAAISLAVTILFLDLYILIKKVIVSDISFPSEDAHDCQCTLLLVSETCIEGG
jgi:hypothetical protein